MANKELNLYIKPGTDVYKVNAGDAGMVEVVIMQDLHNDAVLVEAIYGEPFDSSTAFGGAFMTKQAAYRRTALTFSRKWE